MVDLLIHMERACSTALQPQSHFSVAGQVQQAEVRSNEVHIFVNVNRSIFWVSVLYLSINFSDNFLLSTLYTISKQAPHYSFNAFTLQPTLQITIFAEEERKKQTNKQTNKQRSSYEGHLIHEVQRPEILFLVWTNG